MIDYIPVISNKFCNVKGHANSSNVHEKILGRSIPFKRPSVCSNDISVFALTEYKAE